MPFFLARSTAGFALRADLRERRDEDEHGVRFRAGGPLDITEIDGRGLADDAHSRARFSGSIFLRCSSTDTGATAERRGFLRWPNLTEM